MGGDSGAGRWGLRPDSMTIASIDAETGRTVLIGLPRNMENFPFKEGSVMAEQFPKGFVGCHEDDPCYLNGVSTWAGDHTDLFPGSKNPGTDATIMAIEGITGLDINYWAMVNLQGFKDLVDAVGGVTLNVRQPIPVGGLGTDVTGYIEPGTRKLNGFDTLWYARAREGSDDYSRMARQKCVMNAMLDQISPASALQHFGDLAKASAATISTNIPASEFDNFISLALKAKGQKTASLSLVPPLVVTAHPDIDADPGEGRRGDRQGRGHRAQGAGGKKPKKDARHGHRRLDRQPRRRVRRQPVRRPRRHLLRPAGGSARPSRRVPARPPTSTVAGRPAATRPSCDASARVVGDPVRVATVAAGLGDEQGAGRVVPGLGLAVEHVGGGALDQLREVDAAAGPGQVQGRRGPATARPTHSRREVTPRRRRVARAAGRRSRLAVAERARAAARRRRPARAGAARSRSARPRRRAARRPSRRGRGSRARSSWCRRPGRR